MFILVVKRFLTKKFKPSKCLWFDKFTYVENRTKAQFHLDNQVIMHDEEGPISYHNDGIVRNRYTQSQKKFVDHFAFLGKNDLPKIEYLKLKKKKYFRVIKTRSFKKKENHFLIQRLRI